MSYSKESVKENLEPEDIMTLLDFFNAEPEMFSDYIVCRTICHGGESHKLYYYYNSELFQCYTQCGSFDIFELVQKIRNIDLNAAIYFVVNFLNLQTKLEESEEDYSSEDYKVLARYTRLTELTEDNRNKLVLPEYDLNILNHYPQPKLTPWERDHISKEVCDYLDVHYDPVGGNILIPHRDVDGRCVGIRQRTLIQEQEKYGKYKPWKNHGVLYNHPLAFNLYGLDAAKENIEKMKIAVVVESEKAVMQYISYFGLKNNICVAVCGSSLSKYQFDLLMDCGIKELVIAFDKDFETLGSPEHFELEKKLKKIYIKYGSLVTISFLFDSQCNQLGYKASPLDEGQDKFLYLFRNRIILS